MKLLALGASGGVGQWLVRLAAERGHEVTALVRPTATLDAPQSVRVVRGDPLSSSILAAAVQGQDAVASCIGLRRASKSPWAPLRSPANLVQSVTRALVPVMERAGVRCVVAISGGGVGNSMAQLTAPARWLVTRGNIDVAYQDLAHGVRPPREHAGLAGRAAGDAHAWASDRPRASGRSLRHHVDRAPERRRLVDAGGPERREPVAERSVLLGAS